MGELDFGGTHRFDFGACIKETPQLSVSTAMPFVSEDPDRVVEETQGRCKSCHTSVPFGPGSERDSFWILFGFPQGFGVTFWVVKKALWRVLSFADFMQAGVWGD